MGKLVKNHWARLVTLTAAAYQSAAGLYGIFWPKLFWDWLTITLNALVKPFPYLQIVNIVLGIVIFAFEWPIPVPKKIKPAFDRLRVDWTLRFVMYPLATLAAALLYQGTNPALYYLIGIFAWMWAFSEGELIQPEPWKLPKRVQPRNTPKV